MSRPRPRLAIGMVVAAAVLVAMGIAAGSATLDRDSSDLASGISFVFPIAAFCLVGCLIALRRPENLIGWLLATIGLLFAIVLAASTVSRWALETDALPKTVAECINVAANAWVPALSFIGTQLPLRLPDGKLPSPRWRWFSRITVGLIAVSFVGMAVTPGKVEGVAGTANPIGSRALQSLSVAFILVILSFIGGIAALIARYRRASSHDRTQLKWVVFGGVVFLAIYIVTLPLNGLVGEHTTLGTAITAVSQAAFAALPVSIGYAVLRHRLYDIETVVNRALVYGALTATLAGGYLGSVLLLQLVLSPSSDLAIAASTLAVAALFRPARAHIQQAVDRRFYRRRYDAARTLQSFGAYLRDEVDLDALGSALQAVVAETMQPDHVSLWLRGRP
jgi:hypothetical protein